MASNRLTSHRYRAEGFVEANELYSERGWTDGLPIIPPTEEMVWAFLQAADREPSDVLGVEPVRGRVVTAEKAAINAIMAGCKPDYFPVVVSAAEAICQDAFNLHAITASTMGAAILIVVNGPVVKTLGMNSGINLFGQGNRANATIGRALRLIAMNVVGAIPGGFDKATFGHPGKYSYCIAEAEEVSPWEPLHVERGLSRDDNAVTAFAALAPWQVTNHVGNTPEDILTSLADVLEAVGPNQKEIVMVISPEHLGHIKDAGWDKRRVKEFLAEKAQRTAQEWFEAGRLDRRGPSQEPAKRIGACVGPESVNIIVGGGAAGGFSAIIPLWGGGVSSTSATVKVRFPD